MTTIDLCSDLHGHYPKLEGGDLLIVAGDLTKSDSTNQHLEFSEWLDSQPYRKKIVIAGNHDNNIYPESIDCFNNCHYLQDSGVKIENLKIWGSPWTLAFEGMNPKCKAFTVETEDELEDKFSLIPNDTDILVTHSPPFTILDKTLDGKQVGSTYLMWGLLYRFKPKLWVYGHIHESYGRETFKGRTICVNASYVNEKYEPVNKSVRIIL